MRPTIFDLESNDSMRNLYERWCIIYNIDRSPEERDKRFPIFWKNVCHIFKMNLLDPSFGLSSSCDDKIFLDIAMRPTLGDFESENATQYLYQKWCFYYGLQMRAERFQVFRSNALRIFQLNRVDPLSQFQLPRSCDEELRLEVEMKPTAEDLDSDEATMGLYKNWCLRYSISRSLEDMDKRFYTFKMNAKSIFQMNQLEPDCQFLLSPFCDQMICLEAKVIPKIKDFGSEEAMLELYQKWCLHFNKYMNLGKEIYDIFKRNAVNVYQMNLMDPKAQFHLGSTSNEIICPLESSWLHFGVPPKVLDQGYTGQCQIYASTLALSWTDYVESGRWSCYSKQQVLDMVPWLFLATPDWTCPPIHTFFSWLHFWNKITTENNYPLQYSHIGLQKSPFEPSKVKPPYIQASWQPVSGMQEMMKALQRGPLVGYICADDLLSDFKGRSVFNRPLLDPRFDRVNHAVLILGYGVGLEGLYWIVQNSWGLAWGDGGRFKVVRCVNHRGIEGLAFSPIIYGRTYYG